MKRGSLQTVSVIANETEKQSSGSQSTEPSEQESKEKLIGQKDDGGTVKKEVSTLTKISSIANWIYRHRVQLLITFVKAIAIIIPMAAFFMVNRTKIAELEQPKSVMLYRPSETYLIHEKRPEAVEWRLVEEHSQNPFTHFNTTHLRVKEDGVYAISCTMLIEIDIENKHPSCVTLLIYVNGEKPIYIKKYLSTIFSIQQSIVLKLHQEDTIFVEIHPSKFISKASDASHLSIMQQ